MTGPRQQPFFGRFFTQIGATDANGCWPWRGAKTSRGYGSIFASHLRRTFLAHRVSYTFAKGEIPDGLQIDHLCGNPICVNPDHLEAVTSAVNSQRGIGKLDVEAVADIRSSALSGNALARKYGVSAGAISSVRTGRTWRDVAATDAVAGTVS